MSTGEKLIRATQWQPFDGTTDNAAPGFVTVAGSQAQKIQVPVLQFDGAGSVIEYACYTTRVPVDYASGGTFKILWMANSTSGTVKWQAQVGAVTPADADTILQHAWGAVATSTPSVNATEARRLIETSITLTMDSAAAGDVISFLISRDPINDTCTADAELISVAFQYTADDQAGSPLGLIGIAAVTSQTTTNITTITDLTGYSVTFTALADRYYRISGHVMLVSAAADDICTVVITDGSNNILQQQDGDMGNLSDVTFTPWVIDTPSAGSVTYKLRARRDFGSNQIDQFASGDITGQLLVEDLGSSV